MNDEIGASHDQGAEPTEADLAHQRRIKLNEEKPVLLTSLRKATAELRRLEESGGGPRQIASQKRAVNHLEKRLQANLDGRFLDEESAAFLIRLDAQEAIRKGRPTLSDSAAPVRNKWADRETQARGELQALRI